LQRGEISIFTLFGAGGAAFMYSGGILVTESILSVITPTPCRDMRPAPDDAMGNGIGHV
jgi:hypothetical protein